MKKKKSPVTHFYSDPLNDDFAGTNIKQEKTDPDYPYASRNVFFRFFSFLVYHVLLTPLVFLFLKIAWHYRIANRRVLKKVKHTGYFVYGNHTNALLDAFSPTILNFPKKNYIIANPDATSIHGLKTFVRMNGVVPVPMTYKGTLNFLEGLKYYMKKKRVVVIYPEAHIWPYYTDIRPYKSVSFTYPYEYNVPFFTFTNVYRHSRIKGIRRPRVVTYIDGPFYPDYTLNKREAIEAMRNQAYEAMKRRVDTHPKYETVRYVYRAKEKADDIAE